MPPSEPMLTMRPRAARRCGWAACAIRNGRSGVGGEHLVPLFHGDVFQCRGGEEAGVIDQQIELPELLDHGGDRVADLSGSRRSQRIARASTSNAASSRTVLFCLGLRIAIGDGNIGASLGQPERDGAADALRSAGDELRSCL